MSNTGNNSEFNEKGGELRSGDVKQKIADMTQAEFDALPRPDRAPVPYHFLDWDGEAMDDSLEFIVDRNVADVGVVVGGGDRCRLEGCRGVRISVRWPDGTLTRPCSRGLCEVGLPKVMKIGRLIR